MVNLRSTIPNMLSIHKNNTRRIERKSRTCMGSAFSEQSNIQRCCLARVIATYNDFSYTNIEWHSMSYDGDTPHDILCCAECHPHEGRRPQSPEYSRPLSIVKHRQENPRRNCKAAPADTFVPNSLNQQETYIVILQALAFIQCTRKEDVRQHTRNGALSNAQDCPFCS